jgi:hypothetical protein
VKVQNISDKKELKSQAPEGVIITVVTYGKHYNKLNVLHAT